MTQLGVPSKRKFRIRHGITYEHDALVTRMRYSQGFEALDLTGRAVVLAFRLSGVDAAFPGIVTQRELVEAGKLHLPKGVTFRAWRLSGEDRLRYFKGERWGTSSLYQSSTAKRQSRSTTSVLRQARAAIALAEDPAAGDKVESKLASEFLRRLNTGPGWCQQVVSEYLQFIDDDLLGNLKALVPVLEHAVKKPQP